MNQCGICHHEIYIHQEVVLCPADSTPYHKDCWIYYRGCGILGCRHNPGTNGFIRAAPELVVKAKQIWLPENSHNGKSNIGWIAVLFACAFIFLICCCCSLSLIWFYGDYLFN
jgi:hypothetical protein